MLMKQQLQKSRRRVHIQNVHCVFIIVILYAYQERALYRCLYWWTHKNRRYDGKDPRSRSRKKGLEITTSGQACWRCRDPHIHRRNGCNHYIYHSSRPQKKTRNFQRKPKNFQKNTRKLPKETKKPLEEHKKLPKETKKNFKGNQENFQRKTRNFIKKPKKLQKKQNKNHPK